MYDILALGELLIDFTPDHTDRLRYLPNPGGAPGNVLSAAAKLGATTALIARVGADSFGALLRSAVTAQGIDDRWLTADPDHPTTLAFVHLAEGGERSFSFYRHGGADISLAPEHIAPEAIHTCRVFHFGSVSMTDEPCRSATLHALKLARQAGKLVSYDPNWRPALWRDQAEGVRTLSGVLSQVDILKVSEEELALLTGNADPVEGSRQLWLLGIPLIFVTLGEQGAFYRRGELWGQIPGYKVSAVDTTGAGDAFLGAALSRLCRMGREGIESLSREAVEEIVDFANAAGALVTTRKGALSQMPTPEEILNLRQTAERSVIES